MPKAVQAGRFDPSRGRSTRRPEHRWFVEQYPWEITPVCIAPVLPGESLLNATMQVRAVTDPVKSSVIGWWLEYYTFYVPMSLLPAYTTMVSNVEAGSLGGSIAATAADAGQYYAGRGVNWVDQCLDIVVDEWFRTEEERGTALNIRAGRPAAKVGMEGIDHSLQLGADYPGADGGALGATQRAQEDLYRTYEFLREQGLIQMDWEDYLSTYGVTAPESVRRTRPMLLRYVRQWQYPSNVVNQTTGVPVTAVSWALTERMDKRRYFVEPGFVFMVSVTRPKIYRSNQQAFGAAVMDRLQYWLPALLRDDPLTSLRFDTATTSPLWDGVMAADHYSDVRDLLIHGDQFILGTAPPQANLIALPTATGEAHFATQAMAESLFVNAPATGLVFLRQDGVIRLNIRGAVEDATDATART